MTAIDPKLDPGRRAKAMVSTDLPMLAHDIRGALQGVIGGVVAIERMDASERIAEQLARIATASISLERLVGLMLEDADMSEDSDDNGLDLREFLEDLHRRWNGEAREKGFDFVIDLQFPPAVRFRVGRVALARAVGNLVRNAMTHAGTGRVAITVGQVSDGGMMLCVTDEGPGFPEAVIDRLMRQEDQDRGASIRSGLGLRIVRAICAENGLSFALENNPGDGGTARITLPASLRVEPEPAALDDDAGPPEEKEDAGLRGAHVLLAEDNPTNQMVATQMLRALEARVTISSDGIEALEAFETDRFDLVVVDIEMPRMSGLDVIRAIRNRGDARRETPIVALTAYALREHRDRIAEAGANGLISKPITSIEALGKALAEHIRPRPEEREVGGVAAPTQAASDEPVVDRAIYRSLCDAIGADMMSELLDKVIGDLEEARSELTGAIMPLSLPAVRSVSHILISVAGAIGANRLQHGARALNRAAHDEAEDVAERARALLGELDAAIDFVRAEQAGG